MDQRSTTGEPLAPAGAASHPRSFRGRSWIILALVSAPLTALITFWEVLVGVVASDGAITATSRGVAILGTWVVVYSLLALLAYADIRAARSRGMESSGVMVALCLAIVSSLPILYFLFGELRLLASK